MVKIFSKTKKNEAAAKQAAHAEAGHAVAIHQSLRQQHVPAPAKHAGGVVRAAISLGDLGLSDDNNHEPAGDTTAKLIRHRRREARRRQLGSYPCSLAQKYCWFMTKLMHRLLTKIPANAKGELLYSYLCIC